MNKKKTRICALILSLPFILSSGCKKNKDKRQRVVSESDPYYSCEEVRLDLEFQEEEGKELKSRSIFDSHVYADRVLLFITEKYIVPEDLQKKWDDRIFDPSLTEEDLIKLTDEYSSYNRNGIAVFDYDGRMINFITIDQDANQYADYPYFCEDASGNPKVGISRYSNGYNKATIYDLSSEGELVNAVKLAGDSSGEGEVLFLDNGNILTFD